MWALVAIGVVLCVAIHVVALQYRGSEGLTSRDGWQYWGIADNILAGNGFSYDGETPTRMRQPVYPLVIAGMMSIFGDEVWPLQLLQLLLAMLTVIVAAAIARELFDQRVAGWAALAAGLYYPFAVIATEVRPESVFILVQGAAILAGLRAIRLRSRGWAVACGVLLGLGALTRAPGMAFVAMIPLATWVSLRGHERSWREPVTVAGVALLMLLPWGIRNHVQLGEFTVMSNAGPATMYVGTHPLAIQEWGDYFKTIERTAEYQELLGEGPYLGEGPRERFREAVRTRLREEPLGVAWRGVVKVGLTWTYAPGTRPMLVERPWLFRSLQLPQLALLALMFWGTWRSGTRARWFAIAMFAAVSSAMFLGAPTARYTLPFMVLGLPLAVYGLLTLVKPADETDERAEHGDARTADHSRQRERPTGTG